MKPVAQGIYERNEKMAVSYADKIFDQYKLGLEREDIRQEFRLKLIMLIPAWGRKWIYFRKTGREKPIPRKMYIQGALINFSKDFYKKISKNNNVSMSELSFDYGVDNTELDIHNNKIIIGGVNVMDSLTKDQRSLFKLDLKNTPNKKVKQIFKDRLPNPDNKTQAALIKDTTAQVRNIVRQHIIELGSEVRQYQVFDFSED